MKKQIIEKILDFFKSNEDVFNACIEELDSWNGYLDDGRYYSMDVLNDIYSGSEPMEILQRAYFGHDDDSWTTDSSGNKQYMEFNPNRDYFKFNGYGNLVSTDYPDYSGYLDNYFVESMSDNRCHLDCIDDNAELSALFDELDNVE